MRSAGTPNFSITPAGSMRTFFIVSSRCTQSFTSCAMSLSLVTISTSRPAAQDCLVSVPMTSSASYRSTVSTGRPMARSISLTSGNCDSRSSGVSLRLALYSGYSSLRNTSPRGSKTTQRYSGA